MAGGEDRAEIERDIEARREDLAQTLEQLQARLEPEQLVHRAADAMHAEGAVLARAALRRAGRNPVATAMVAAGLAWLIFGPDARPAPARAPRGLRSAPPPPPVERRRSRPPRGPVPSGRPAPMAGRTGDGGERRVPTHDVRGTPVATAAPSQGQ